MRDINALRRSRTFVKEGQNNNNIQIKPSQLKYFHYVDVFKDYAIQYLPYYLGNLEVIIYDADFQKIAYDFEVLSKSNTLIFSVKVNIPLKNL
ncbi:MAG: hypothetical protein LBP35_04350 [Candidatus Ancillula trichonymphae]|nr:hypothetical protein [Candidatus Ancillula trichonymphae]